MKTKRKNKLRCAVVPEPCVQLCIRTKFRSCVWSLHTLHLHLNHSPFWLWWRAGAGLERKISENGTAIFGQTGPDRPVKEGHLWRWTTFTGKFPPGPNRSIYVWTEISGNSCIMASTPDLHCREGFDWENFGVWIGRGGGGRCHLTRGGRIWSFDCIK